MATEGPLALVGGNELTPGNEPIDSILATAAAGGEAFVVATAAARQGAAQAVRNAQRWFRDLGVDVEELPATTAAHTRDPEGVARARAGRFFYLVGGDPGLVPKLLRGSPLWSAVVDAWRDGAALGGSSAGAMALGGWTLIRERMPGDRKRRYGDALNLVPGIAVVPHFDTFGKGWVDSALDRAPVGTTLVALDERTGAVWTQGAWQVLGAGSVAVITRTDRRTYATGTEIDAMPSPQRR
ncbi:MAG: Type 1 glutamine amidotransferase-like domain-containing protein [Actinomycetota bacterium]